MMSLRRDHYPSLTAHSPTVRKSPSRLNDPPLGFIGSIPWRCNSMPYKDILSFPAIKIGAQWRFKRSIFEESQNS
jgi:hypothetical protein